MADDVALQDSLARDIPADSDPVPPAAPTAAPIVQRRRRWLRPLLFAALPLALAAGGYYYVTGGQIVSTENAYVQADMVGVSTDVAGIVKQVEVRDNQHVSTGDVLYRLDDQPFALALARGNAQLGNVRNDLMLLKSNYRDMQTQIVQARNDIAYYSHEFQRQQDLGLHQATTQVAVDSARHALQTAQQKLASLNQQLQGIAASLNGDPDIRIEDHPRYLEAAAQRDEAARQLAHTVVRAPMAGIVTNVPSIQPGQYLAVSTVAFNVVAADHVWIQASPKETELTHIRPGQPVAITVDTDPDETWNGSVESISPASSASFSLLPAQNTTGNWVKVVQRIPVRIRIITLPDKPMLRVGMSVVVNVDTGHARGLPTFLTAWFGAPGRTKVAQLGVGNG